MRRILLCTFSVLLISGPLTMQQWVKLPFLFAHYAEEKPEGVDFLTYLDEHYNHETGFDKDAASDSRLPFKSSCDESVQTTSAAFFAGVTVQDPPVTSEVFYIPLKCGPCSLFTHDLLRPPQG